MVAVAASGVMLQVQPASADAPSNSPCDFAAALPVCTTALGPLRDVTATWQSYQPALVQPVPISDYYPSDPEDSKPPLGFGHCGTETTPVPPPAIPASTESATLPAGIGPPPGKHSPFPGSRYCLLRYIPSDFNPLCDGCRRILIDYSGIPVSGFGAAGHWAGRFTPGKVLAATIPFNSHSPNIKNLCSDKFLNPAAGSGCATLGSLDAYFLEMEGDTGYFHHFPLEGRYYNGPAYLAIDGRWVTGAYFDINPAGATSIWYGAGYRPANSLLPDTDQSYGCLCEVPPAGGVTFSASYDLGGSTAAGPGAPAGAGTPASGALGAVAGPLSGVLPTTSASSPAAVVMPIVPGVLVLVIVGGLWHRRRHPR